LCYFCVFNIPQNQYWSLSGFRSTIAPHLYEYKNILPVCYHNIYTKVPYATSTGWITPFFPEIQAQGRFPLPLIGGSVTFMMGYGMSLLAFLMEI